MVGNGCRQKRVWAYIDERFLSLNGDPECVPANLDVQILALVFGINRDGDVHVLDGLLPFVG